jgi:hypothetical protein
MVSRRRWRTVIVGEGASVGIGRQLRAREHEWRSGKLAEELAGAMGDRRLLPMATSTLPEGRSGRRKQLELGVLAAGGLAVQLERAQATGVAEQKEREIRQARARFTVAARWRPAGARGDRGARKAGQRGGEQGRARGEDYAWKEKKQEVDGGGLHGGGRGSCTGGRAEEAEEQRTEGVQREKKRGNRPEGLVWNFQKVQGPLSKLKILTDIEVK